MQVNLLSLPGEHLIQNIVAACAPYLKSAHHPLLAYLPAASLDPPEKFLDLTREAFAGLCEIEMIDLFGKPDQSAIARILSAAVIYIPGGNTYLLRKRLQTSGLFEPIRKAVKEGLPYVGFSAGAVICGTSIHLSGDANECGCTDFAGFGFLPYAIDVHYSPDDKESHSVHISRISRFQELRPIPVLAMEDDAHLIAFDSTLELIRGSCWLIQPGSSPIKIPIGRILY